METKHSKHEPVEVITYSSYMRIRKRIPRWIEMHWEEGLGEKIS
jgi:hypothetical protein